VKSTGFDPDTPVKLQIVAFHSVGDVSKGEKSYRELLATLDAIVDGEGNASAEYELAHDRDAKIKVRAEIEDKHKTSRPLTYLAEPPSEGAEPPVADADDLSTDEEEDEGKDVNAFAGDKVKLMAETADMPEFAKVMLSVYPDGKTVDDRVAAIEAQVQENTVVAEWPAESPEDATLVFDCATPFSSMTSENKLHITVEPPDDLATEKLAKNEASGSDAATASARAAAPGTDAQASIDAGNAETDDLSSAAAEGAAEGGGDEVADASSTDPAAGGMPPA
jgi:hypothetical protein